MQIVICSGQLYVTLCQFFIQFANAFPKIVSYLPNFILENMSIEKGTKHVAVETFVECCTYYLPRSM